MRRACAVFHQCSLSPIDQGCEFAQKTFSRDLEPSRVGLNPYGDSDHPPRGPIRLVLNSLCPQASEAQERHESFAAEPEIFLRKEKERAGDGDRDQT